MSKDLGKLRDGSGSRGTTLYRIAIVALLFAGSVGCSNTSSNGSGSDTASPRKDPSQGSVDEGASGTSDAIEKLLSGTWKQESVEGMTFRLRFLSRNRAQVSLICPGVDSPAEGAVAVRVDESSIEFLESRTIKTDRCEISFERMTVRYRVDSEVLRLIDDVEETIFIKE